MKIPDDTLQSLREFPNWSYPPMKNLPTYETIEMILFYCAVCMIEENLPYDFLNYHKP